MALQQNTNRAYLNEKLDQYYARLAELLSRTDEEGIRMANATTCKIESIEWRIANLDSQAEVIAIPDHHISSIRFFNH